MSKKACTGYKCPIHLACIRYHDYLKGFKALLKKVPVNKDGTCNKYEPITYVKWSKPNGGTNA